MRLAVYGYGNLGKGVELAARAGDGTEFVGVFTRRDPAGVAALPGTVVYPADELMKYRDEIDVLAVCAGSATDLPTLTPSLARYFNVIDTFDTHAKMAEHITETDKAAKEGGNAAIVGAGWDPGLFSLARLYFSAVIPGCAVVTQWGRGVSRGHSEAVRGIPGVLDAVEYTVPDGKAARDFVDGKITDVKKLHKRECYVVASRYADKEKIRRRIETMPDYFEGYETSVFFVTAEELEREHSSFAHGGAVTAAGNTDGHRQTARFSLDLASNPEFTGSVVLAYARALDRMKREGKTGCFTVFDVPPRYLTDAPYEELLKKL